MRRASIANNTTLLTYNNLTENNKRENHKGELPMRRKKSTKSPVAKNADEKRKMESPVSQAEESSCDSGDQDKDSQIDQDYLNLEAIRSKHFMQQKESN